MEPLNYENESLENRVRGYQKNMNVCNYMYNLKF